ncbi:PAS domain S-box-containing protein [Hymenobacter gelipurpurascens]|uniref:histidine kinase n=1 Tax=Hymenobacter gelipurpurascens TaxID=89968 RepID=A0A212TPX8_9BACT|nr:PAS domain-containing protein [Hymenobacter gelipurpurascens]SNC68043.1 PAS domain S-box-containing protein [Hymenobacter gelipurpurascens]
MLATSALLPIFNALPDAYLLLSPALLVEAASDAYLAATLTKREQLVGQYIFDAFPDNPQTPEARAVENLRASLAKVLATGQPHEMAQQHYDVPNPELPGQFVERHWLPRNIPILDELGQVAHILHVVTNVTTQVHDAKELRASKAREMAALTEAETQRNRLQALISQAPALIASLRGSAHVIELANESFKQMFGNRELIGKPYSEAVPELGEQGFIDLLDKVYQTGETHYGNEVLAYIDRTNSGQREPLYFNFTYQATHTPAGEIEGVLLFAYDVTTQVVARQQVQQLNGELEARVTERTQALQQAQLEAERQRTRLHRFFMQAPAAICILDGPELVYELVNPGYQELFPGRELLGRPIAEALPEIVGHSVYQTFRSVYETGVTHEEYSLLIPIARPEDGVLENRYFNYIQQARHDEQGLIDGVLVFALEVTEQVLAHQQAEAAQTSALAAAELLAAQRENFHRVFEQTPASIAILRGPNHQFDYVNPGYQQLFPGRQLVGRSMVEALPETIEFGFVALLDRVFQTREPFFGAEMPLRVADEAGHLLPEAYFTFTYQAYQEQGQTAGVSIFAFEVTEQVLARREAVAQQAQLQTLFEQAPVAIAIFQGSEQVIAVANPRMAALWGRTPEQVVGKPMLEALPEIRDQGFKELLDQVVTTGEAFVANEVKAVLQRNGLLETVYFNFVYQPMRNLEGKITSVAGVATEVGEQVKARQQMQALNDQLQASVADLGASNKLLTRTNQDLDNFVYAASHDLKQPVNNLAGLFGELQRNVVFTDKAEEELLLPLIQEALQQLSITIDDLAALGQAQQVREVPAELVSLEELTEEVLSSLEPQARAARARVTTDFTARPTVSFARANLRTVLQNLLANSFKYADPTRPARIHLSVWLDEGQPVLVVDDNGLGFDAEKYGAELFHLFRRFHHHTAGTGVGLYLVNRIVQANGGSIEVESQEGEGATFRVRLGPA